MGCEHDPAADFFIRPREAGGEGPGVHALVVGTSKYEYSHKGRSEYDKFADIPGAAFGAGKFAKFLSREYHDPLGREILTIRVLLSPMEDEERALKDDLGVTWAPADGARVEAALKVWFDDCDQSPDNIMVLYLAGHGLTRPASYTHIFLKAEGDEPNPFYHSINLDVIQEALAYSYCQNKIIITDCCAEVYAERNHRTGIMLDPKYSRSDELRRVHQRYEPLHIAGAQTDGKAYTLSAREGTMLSYVLEKLLQSAGELVRHPMDLNDRYFAITQAAMSEQIEPIFRGHPQAKDIWDGGPIVNGHTAAGGMHRPKPPPEFDVEFVVSGENVSPVDVEITTIGGEPVKTTKLFPGHKLELPLQAGIYIRDPHSKAEFTIDRPLRFDLPSWRVEKL
jgi:Caspase domain